MGQNRMEGLWKKGARRWESGKHSQENARYEIWNFLYFRISLGLLIRLQVTHVCEYMWDAGKSHGESEAGTRKFLSSPLGELTHARCQGGRQGIARQIFPAVGQKNRAFVGVFLSQICQHRGHKTAR